MREDYLWDRSGEPDPEVEKLENLLGRLRQDVPPPRFELPAAGPQRRFGWLWRWQMAAATAAVVVVLAAGLWLALRPSPEGWQVASLQGAPVVGRTAVTDTGKLPVGQWLETDAASRARIEVGLIGHVEVEPNSRVGLVNSRPLEYRLELERGTIHARIWAPPRLFFVNTPVAEAIDLGCIYTLEVEETGAGRLEVDSGWVLLDDGRREAMVPAGAAAEMRPGFGPGTPYSLRATERFREALAEVNFGPAEARAQSLRVVLAEARPADALTLLSLLSRVEAEERGLLFDRLAQLLPPPAGVTREGIVRGDRTMTNRWWDRLDLGDLKKSGKKKKTKQKDREK